MLVARNKKGTLVTLSEKNEEERDMLNQQNFYCPSCRKPVFLKNGKLRQPHFSHYGEKNCSSFSEGETMEHLMGKKLLAEWLTEHEVHFELEALLPEIMQRPDLLIDYKDEKIAIEFQCSPLSSSDMQIRTRGYIKAGYKVLWLLGERYQLTTSLKKNQRQFLNYKETLNYYFFHLNVAKKKLYRYTNVFVLPNNIISKHLEKTIFDCRHHFTEWLAGKNTFFTKYCMEEELDRKDAHQVQEQIRHYLYYREKNHLSVQEKLYMKNLHALFLPEMTYLPVYTSPLLKTPAYYIRYLFLCFLKKKRAHTSFNEQSIENWWQQKIVEKEIVYYEAPLVKKSFSKDFANELIFYNQIGIIEKNNSGDFSVKEKLFHDF